MRLNKFLSHHGVCSRRKADELIALGKVSVNGVVITTPYIVEKNDTILVDGHPINKKKTSQKWLFYKPIDYITTHNDPQNRKTVFDHPNVQKLGHVISVGRLDINSEGLLLLTNDPSFAHYAESPQTGWERIYKVRVFGEINYKQLDELKNGIMIDKIKYAPILVSYEIKQSKNQWITVTLTEGKNREIRKIMEHFGLKVSRLIRVTYGPYSLENMKPGDILNI